MTDNEKIPYLQCLYHTGKKVYKYWLATLAVIGVVIALGLIVSRMWKQIVDCATTIGNAFGYVGYIIINLFTNAWVMVCTIPWYWCVSAGVIIGPLVLVAIWCALKHFNIDIILFTMIVITIASMLGVFNFFVSSVASHLNVIDVILLVCSITWMMILAAMCLAENNYGSYDYYDNY